VQFTIRDTGDLKRLNKALKVASNGKQLRSDLRRKINAELKVVVRAVQAAYSGGTHLRPALRKATRSEFKLSGRSVGARVRVDGRKMPARMGSLPAMREGRKRWRHPVFANRDNWVSQSPQPVFDLTVKPFEQPVGRAVQEAAQETVDKLERAT
jgi:hypothetical protein